MKVWFQVEELDFGRKIFLYRIADRIEGGLEGKVIRIEGESRVE